MADIVVFRFFAALFMVLWLMIPMVGAATDAKDVVQLAAREAGRKASITSDITVVRSKAEEVIQGSGKPLSYNGQPLFDKNHDVDVNFYDGVYCTVTVHYRHYLLSPSLMSLIGGDAIGPTINLQTTVSFERNW